MRYKVPHYIEREAKILGPASFSQLGYLAVAAFIIAFLYLIMGASSFLFYIISFFVVTGGLAMAFLQIEGQSFPVYVKKAALFSFTSKKYIWKQKDVSINTQMFSKYEKKKKEQIKDKEEEKKEEKSFGKYKRSRLEDISKKIETS